MTPLQCAKGVFACFPLGALGLWAKDSYMTHAFPADELRPLTCDGRLKRERGDLDAMLGNYSMPLGRRADGREGWGLKRGCFFCRYPGSSCKGKPVEKNNCRGPQFCVLPFALRTLIDALDSLVIFKRKTAFKASPVHPKAPKARLAGSTVEVCATCHWTRNLGHAPLWL